MIVMDYYMLNVLYSIAFVLVASLGGVFIHKGALTIPPQLLLFFSILIAIVFFNLYNIKDIAHVYKKLWYTQKGLLLIVNLNIFVLWTATYYSNYLSSATVSRFISFISLGISTQIFRGKAFTWRTVPAVLSIFLVTLHYSHYQLGILIAAIAGVSLLPMDFLAIS